MTQDLSIFVAPLSNYEPPESFWEWLTSAGRKHLESVALKCLHQPPTFLSNFLRHTDTEQGQSYFSWTYAQLIEASESLADHLFSRGVRANDVICCLATNGAEWAVMMWAAARLGATFAAIDPFVVKRIEEFDFLMKSLSPVAIFVQNATSTAMFDSIASLKAKLTTSSSRNGWTDISSIQFDQTCCSGYSFRPTVDDFCLILCTSGSTGLPKLVPKSVENWTSEIEDYRTFAESKWSNKSNLVVTTSNFRPICCIGTVATWQIGGTVVVPAPSFEEEAVLKAIVNHKITHMMVVPAALSLLTDCSKRTGIRPGTMQYTGCSGDIADADALQRGREQLRIRRLVGAWGMTETHPVFGWLKEEHIPTTEQNVVGMGRPLPGSGAKLCAPGTDRLVRRGDKGELHISSRSLINGYGGFNPPNEPFYQDEHGMLWFNTGDLAIMNETGVVFIVGRTKEMIKYKGFGIIPSILEDYIQRQFDLVVCYLKLL